jgi:hypothetical protein
MSSFLVFVLFVVLLLCVVQYAMFFGIATAVYLEETEFEKHIGARVRGRTLSDAIATVEAAGTFRIVPATEGTPCPRSSTVPPTVILEMNAFTGLVSGVNLCTGEHVDTDLRSDVLGY